MCTSVEQHRHVLFLQEEIRRGDQLFETRELFSSIRSVRSLQFGTGAFTSSAVCLSRRISSIGHSSESETCAELRALRFVLSIDWRGSPIDPTVLSGVTLSKLNDYENALRAYNYSLKHDPTDPMALLNFAILQHNNGASRSTVDATLQQFYQYYAAREASVNPRELDPTMRAIAEQISGPTSSSLQPPAARADQDEPSSMPPPYSPRQPPPSKATDDDSPRKAPQELPTVRTKIYDDGRHRGRRAKAPADAETVQTDEKELSNEF